MKLIYLSLSWIAGVCVGMWAGFHWVTIVAIAAIALLTLVLRRRKALLFVLCLIVLLSGLLRFQATIPAIDESSPQFYNDTGTVTIKGLVTKDPEVTAHSVALHLEAREINVGDGWRDVSGTVLVYVPRLSSPDVFPVQNPRDPPHYRYGDLLQVEGKLMTPPQLDDFDWQEYLARKGIHSIISYPDRVELLASGQGFAPLDWLYTARNRLSRSLDSALHEPQAALAQAMLLGKRSTIPDELRESLAQTGTAHIIAISGLHLGIVGGIVLSLLVWFFGRRRITYFLLTIGIIWGYALLTGLHAPVLRAAIMVSLWLFADYVGRPRSALTSLLFAAALMIGIHPSILREVSFQMSFAAIAGVVVLTPMFQSWGRRAFRIPEDSRGFRSFAIDSLSFTLGAVVTTLPVIAFYFHHISLVALPANFCALPALPFAIITAALVAVVGLFALPLAQVLGWVSWLFISYMIEVIEAFSALPFASLEIEAGAAFVWGYYAVLGIALWVVSNRSRLGTIASRARARTLSTPSAVRNVPTRFIVFPLIMVAALVWTAAVTTPDDRLHIHVLDVGQGDAILIQRGHQQVLIDGGPDSQKLCLELGDTLPFWDRTIELVVLTHPEADHITGLVEVIQRYDVEHILTSGQEDESPGYTEWLRAVEQQDVERTIARAGQTIELADGVTLEVLHPQDVLLQETSSDINNNSVVLRLGYHDFSLLLTGDILEEAEQCMLDGRFCLKSTVLKVAHHGSDTSSCSGFLAGVDPRVAVISAGAENPFGHPDPEVVERLHEFVGNDGVYLTSEQGTIELITDGERLWVQTER